MHTVKDHGFITLLGLVWDTESQLYEHVQDLPSWVPDLTTSTMSHMLRLHFQPFRVINVQINSQFVGWALAEQIVCG
jgi:hypothetical protein